MDIEGFTQVDEVLLDVEAVRTIFISSAQLGSYQIVRAGSTHGCISTCSTAGLILA